MEQENLIMQGKLLFYFALYSFIGWCIESIYKTFLEKKWVNSGFLYGPFCPIYGFGVVLMILLLKPLQNSIFVIFVASALLLTTWEYAAAVILEKIFKTKYWDYSDLKFNFQGRICLKNSIYWGIMGTMFTFIVHPFIENKVELISTRALFYTNIFIYIIFITDVIITVTKVLFIDKKIQQLHEISNTIKEKINELKKAETLEKVAVENITAVIAELKQQQAILKIKLYKLIIRLKRAFPTMQSETISKFLNQKIEIKKIINKLGKNKGE